MLNVLFYGPGSTEHVSLFPAPVSTLCAGSAQQLLQLRKCCCYYRAFGRKLFGIVVTFLPVPPTLIKITSNEV